MVARDAETPKWFFSGEDQCPQCNGQTTFAFTCLAETDKWCDYCKEPHPASLIAWGCTVCEYLVEDEDKVRERFDGYLAGVGIEPHEVSVCLLEKQERRFISRRD